MSERGRLLVVLDRRRGLRSLAADMSRRGFDLVWVGPPGAADEALRAADVDVVLCAYDDGEGLEISRRVFHDHDGLPVQLIVPEEGGDLLDAATRAGAFGALMEPVDPGALELALDRAVEHAALRREVERLEAAVQETRGFEDLVGSSPVMRRLYDLLERAADSDATVLVTGESGTGKELVAEALHRRSRRAEGPFVAVNCAAVPDPLLESELFGHEKGAFTDAKASRRGLFEQANGGTLFLDEVAELGLQLQPKLLRALQKRVIRRVGASTERAFDARVIAATNRDLETLVVDGRFREDLYYRLHVIHVELPPLRSRGQDVLLLARLFLDRLVARSGKPIEGLSRDAEARLLAYRWPGNVRELENAIEHAVALTRGRRIELDDLPERIRGFKSNHVVVAASDPEELVPMHVVEERYIRRVMQAVRNNKSQAARILGFDRKTLRRKLVRYGIEAERPT